MHDALLVLADGSIYEGHSVGVPGHADGEVVFNTSMTGYQEMLTDPSYAGQLLVLTYPMVGNYGIDDRVEESGRIQPTGLIVREAASFASHLRSTGTLSEFLRRRGVVAIDGVDTRAITRRIRRHGVMPGTITTTERAEAASERLRAMPGYDDINWVNTVTTKTPYDWRNAVVAGVTAEASAAIPGAMGHASSPGAQFRVALLDGGVKRNIMRELSLRGCAVTVYPAETTARDILDTRPDGIVLSPGPGDPRLLDVAVAETRKLIGKAPMLGICLGHQVAARALGAGTYKLPFGHRGGNHPVKELCTGKVTITAQNHGYAVDADALDSSAFVSHLNLNDETVEGLAMRTEPLITIQYHSEACPGPLDNSAIFDRFVAMMARVPEGVK